MNVDSTEAYCPIDLEIPFLLTEEVPDYDSVPYYWRRVSGAFYCVVAYTSVVGSRTSLKTSGRISIAFEAVPEPDNPWDPCAVRLDINGKKAGYVNAGAAPKVYSIARYWEMQGRKCLLPGVFWADLREGCCDYELNSWVALPTIQEVRNHVPVDLIAQELIQWWERAPQDIREDLDRCYFRLSHEVYNHLVENSDKIPHVPLEGAAEGNSPLVVEWALSKIRNIVDEAKAREGALARQRYENDILESVRAGMSYAATARTFGISAPTVSRIAKKHGVESVGNAMDVVRTLERCRTALSLQSSGRSVAEIGEIMGVSARSVEKLLGNGRFYTSPGDYPKRKRLAERQMRGELNGDAALSDHQMRQARRDAVILAHLKLERE